MHLSTVWYIPLAIAGAGSVAAAVAALLVRKEVTELQKSLRPLRVPTSRRGPR